MPEVVSPKTRSFIRTPFMGRKRVVRRGFTAGRPADIEKGTGRLLARIRGSLAALRELAEQCRGHWTYEDGVYRFYHKSCKVYYLQNVTLKIVDALKGLAPGRELDPDFMRIVSEGTGKSFSMSDNAQWLKKTRPIVEAYFHAFYFLDMAVRYGERLKKPPQVLPSGWAALLTLYGLR